MEFAILKGRDPFALDSIETRAERYVILHKGHGERSKQAYIQASLDMLKYMGRLAL